MSLTFLIREAEISKYLGPFPETSNIYSRKGQVLSACHNLNTKDCYFIFWAERMNNEKVTVGCTRLVYEEMKMFLSRGSRASLEFSHPKGKMPINLNLR